MMIGMRRERIKAIIMESVDRNPDLKYYINDDYIYELVDAIADGVSRAIEENTQEVLDDLKFRMR